MSGKAAAQPSALDGELACVGPGRAALDRGHFREQVTCAAALVGRGEAEDAWWAVAVSERGEQITDEVIGHVLRAAHDLTFH